MHGLKRNAEAFCNELLSQFPVLIILGARQCGKTTLAKNLRPGWRYFDLENSNDYDFITRDLGFFFKENPDTLIIDEAQTFPQLFRELRGVIDRDRHIKNRMILTGSSSAELLENVSESLPGRAAIVEIGTLKFNEYYGLPLSSFYDIFKTPLDEASREKLLSLRRFISHSDLKYFFLKGGYPEPLLAKNDAFYSAWMAQYTQTYIQRDIRRLFPRLDLVRFRRFIAMLSGLSGNLVNKSEIGRAVQTSEVTIGDYLDIAEGTFIWRNVYPFEGSRKKSLIKTAKGIFRDSGLCHFLNTIHTIDDLDRYAKLGTDFEAFVIEELIKGMNSIFPVHWSYHYLRTRSHAEIDLILQGPFGLLPIEIKYGTATQLNSFRAITEFVRAHHLPFGIVINNGDEVKNLSPELIQVPVTYI